MAAAVRPGVPILSVARCSFVLGSFWVQFWMVISWGTYKPACYSVPVEKVLFKESRWTQGPATAPRPGSASLLNPAPESGRGAVGRGVC